MLEISRYLIGLGLAVAFVPPSVALADPSPDLIQVSAPRFQADAAGAFFELELKNLNETAITGADVRIEGESIPAIECRAVSQVRIGPRAPFRLACLPKEPIADARLYARAISRLSLHATRVRDDAQVWYPR